MSFNVRPQKILVLVLLLIATIGSTLGGYASARLGLDLLLYGRASESWPSVKGRVEDAYVADEESESGSISRAHIEYSYTVNGNAYKGRRLGFGVHGSGSRDDAQKVLAEHPLGSEVSVLYHEEKPQISTLQPGLFANPWPPILIGLLFMAVGAILASVAYHEAKR
jgi:hypothetical protein